MICQFKFYRQVTLESGLCGFLFGCFPSRKLSLFCCLLQPLLFSVLYQQRWSTTFANRQLLSIRSAFTLKFCYLVNFLFVLFCCLILISMFLFELVPTVSAFEAAKFLQTEVSCAVCCLLFGQFCPSVQCGTCPQPCNCWHPPGQLQRQRQRQWQWKRHIWHINDNIQMR